MKLYAVYCDKIDRVHQVKYFTTRELARGFLKKKKKEISTNAISLTVIESTPDKFSFYFGWEEHSVCWKITEINVIEE